MGLERGMYVRYHGRIWMVDGAYDDMVFLMDLETGARDVVTEVSRGLVEVY